MKKHLSKEQLNKSQGANFINEFEGGVYIATELHISKSGGGWVKFKGQDASLNGGKVVAVRGTDVKDSNIPALVEETEDGGIDINMGTQVYMSRDTDGNVTILSADQAPSEEEEDELEVYDISLSADAFKKKYGIGIKAAKAMIKAGEAKAA